jgi:hypothetical protein
VYIETRSSISAMLAAAQMARLSWRTVNGCMGSSPREQPPVGQDLPLGVSGTPPGAQPLQQQRREHRVAILAALARLDAQRHALAVDVGDLHVLAYRGLGTALLMSAFSFGGTATDSRLDCRHVLRFGCHDAPTGLDSRLFRLVFCVPMQWSRTGKPLCHA